MTEDSDILLSIKRDAETGFRLLMSYYREPVCWHIRRMVIHHADAQDATQETFIRVFRSISEFKGESSLKVFTVSQQMKPCDKWVKNGTNICR